MFEVYWLISENKKRTYVGFSNNLAKRIGQHRNREVARTRNFGKFRCFRLEKVNNLTEARKKEKYWKSAVGRRKLKKLYYKVFEKPPSSIG